MQSSTISVTTVSNGLLEPFQLLTELSIFQNCASLLFQHLSASRMRYDVIILDFRIVLNVLEHYRNKKQVTLFCLEISNALLLHTICIPVRLKTLAGR